VPQLGSVPSHGLKSVAVDSMNFSFPKVWNLWILMSLIQSVPFKTQPNTWTPSRTKRRNQWQYCILAAVSRCCSWCTAWNRYGSNFSCFVARWVLVTDKHFLYPEIPLPVSAVLSYSVLPCQDTHWTDVLLVNTPCSHLHSFCATAWAAA
jgi:hypothetical protein